MYTLIFTIFALADPSNAVRLNIRVPDKETCVVAGTRMTAHYAQFRAYGTKPFECVPDAPKK